MDNFGLGVVVSFIAVLVLFLVFVFGGQIKANTMKNDCDVIGVVVITGVVYECHKQGEKE